MAGRAMGSNKKKADGTITKEQDELFVCPHCGKTKKRSEFYVSRDPAVVIGIAFPCKDCSEKIARNYNPKNGEFGDVTPASLQRACEYLDVPFLEKIWNSALSQVQDESHERMRRTVWGAYIKDVNSLNQYRGLRWRDGDIFKENKEILPSLEETKLPQNSEALTEYNKNKNDIIRLIGYDPFDKESEADKPLLYAQLIGYIDSDGNNDDMTRILDSIEVVRGYLQLQKLNDMSALAFANLAKTGQAGEIKSYMDTKKKVADVISQLAEQSCISLKHNKNAKKGENTWTGKIKKLKELNLREAEVNGFDIGTCRGMQQVMDLSNKSIIRALNLDESEYSDMIVEQRQMITDLISEKENYKEIARILLRENLDIKEVLKDNDLLDDTNLVDLVSLFSCFSSIEEDAEEIEEDIKQDNDDLLRDGDNYA